MPSFWYPRGEYGVAMDIKKWEDLATEVYRMISHNNTNDGSPVILNIHNIPNLKVYSIVEMFSFENHKTTPIILENDFHIGAYYYITNARSLAYLLYLTLELSYDINIVRNLLHKHSLLTYSTPF